MQKTKFALVSLLSLLIVLVPVSTALAEHKEHLREKNTPKTKDIDNKGVFQKIEEQGGEEATENKLERAKGEFWGVVGAAAAGGAVVSSGYYASTYALGMHGWDWSEFTSETIGAAAGAAVGAATGSISAGKACAAAASAAGSFVGKAVGDLIGGLW